MTEKTTALFTGLIALVIPFFLIMTAIRLLFTPFYPQVVYQMPGFPEDRYGFTLEDRLHWSRISIEYLLNDAGIEYLADQRLPDGQPLYNERELSHMLDVKIVLQGMVTAWTILLVVLAGLALWAWRAGWLPAYVHGLGAGGKLTIGLIVLVLAAVAISFNALFTAFHRIFFAGDSWLFLYSDSLIRLFPLPFWQAGFVLMGVFTILGAALLIFLERRLVH
jgi:integral membrane protein (TIGR01906 family)